MSTWREIFVVECMYRWCCGFLARLWSGVHHHGPNRYYTGKPQPAYPARNRNDRPSCPDQSYYVALESYNSLIS